MGDRAGRQFDDEFAPSISLGADEGEYRRLVSAMEFITGFSLQLVRCAHLPVLMEIHRRLAAFERSRGGEIQVVFPPYLVDQTLMVERLLAVRSTMKASGRVAVILWPQVATGEFEEAWRTVCSALNRRRDWFRTEWHNALLIFGNQRAHEAFRTEAPDLWALRSGIYSFTRAEFMGDGADLDGGEGREPARKMDLRDFSRRDSGPLGVLAEVSLKEGLLDEAETWARMAVEMDEAVGDRANLAADLNVLARVEVERGRPREAEVWLDRAIGITQELSDAANWAIGHLNMAAILATRGQHAKAEGWLRKAWDAASTSRSVALRSFIGEALADHLRRGQRYAEAALLRAELEREI